MTKETAMQKSRGWGTSAEALRCYEVREQRECWRGRGHVQGTVEQAQSER